MLDKKHVFSAYEADCFIKLVYLHIVKLNLVFKSIQLLEITIF